MEEEIDLEKFDIEKFVEQSTDWLGSDFSCYDEEDWEYSTC